MRYFKLGVLAFILFSAKPSYADPPVLQGVWSRCDAIGARSSKGTINFDSKRLHVDFYAEPGCTGRYLSDFSYFFPFTAVVGEPVAGLENTYTLDWTPEATPTLYTIIKISGNTLWMGKFDQTYRGESPQTRSVALDAERPFTRQ